MMHRRRAAALLLAVAMAVPALLRAQAQQRVVFVSAIDKSGAPVSGLGVSDFIVREDNVAREVLNVEPASEPMQIALLVDNSQAADPFVRDIREGLTTFIQTIGADPSGARHQVAVITIGERPTTNTDFTPLLDQAIKGAQRIFAMPSSAAYLLDGVMETSATIKKRELSHPVMVAVITSGVDMSDRVYQSALEPLHESGATLHVVVVGRPVIDDQDRMIFLDLGTRDTGGRYDTVLASTGLPSRLKQVAEELTHQYKITYARPDRLIPPDRVTVSAANPGLTVRGNTRRTLLENGSR